MTNKFNKLYFSPIVAIAILSGCGGGDSSVFDIPKYTPPDFDTEQTGYLIDSPVQGIDYYCGNIQGVTNSDGKFTYKKFECINGIEFKIGSLSLGTMRPLFISNTSDKYLTIQELAGNVLHRAMVFDEKVTKLAVMLQSLDDDGNPDNGILITQNIKNSFTTNLKLKDLTDDSISMLISNAGKTEKDAYTALSHLLAYTKSKDSSVSVVMPTIFQSGELWKGKQYSTSTSPMTQRVWLDRNLGATQVCTSSTDTACYGDYYQWGRNADGHQLFNSTTTTTLAVDLNTTGNSSFIKNSSSPYDWTALDSDGALRSANWSKTDGSSVCPVGFRVPTEAEFKAETIGATNPNTVTNSATAFSSFLKLPSAGARTYDAGSMLSYDSIGGIWSSSHYGMSSVGLFFDNSVAVKSVDNRAFGISVRCIRD